LLLAFFRYVRGPGRAHVRSREGCHADRPPQPIWACNCSIDPSTWPPSNTPCKLVHVRVPGSPSMTSNPCAPFYSYGTSRVIFHTQSPSEAHLHAEDSSMHIPQSLSLIVLPHCCMLLHTYAHVVTYSPVFNAHACLLATCL